MNRVVVSAHQSNLFPYLGFFDKMKNSDVLVIRDEVAYTKRDFHHKNKIRINSEDNINNPRSEWIGLPVENTDKFLKDVLIKDGKRGKKHWKDDLCHRLKTSYSHAPYFDEHFPKLKEIIDDSAPDAYLVDFNMQIIEYIAKAFDINTPMVRASEYGLRINPITDSDPSQDLVDIVKAAGGNTYLSGSGGRNYLDRTPFDREGIELLFQDYQHPKYTQSFPGFLPYMSAADALFCVGHLPKVNIIEDENEYRTEAIR